VGLFPAIPIRSAADTTLNFETLLALLSKWGLGASTTPVATKAELAAIQRNVAGSGGGGAVTGTVLVRSITHATEVLATGTSKTTTNPKLQEGEEDKITFTTPAGGALYTIYATLAAKNPGSGYGGGAIFVDSERLKVVIGEAGPVENVSAAGSGTFIYFFSRPTRSAGEQHGWEKGPEEGVNKLIGAEPYSIFLPAGSHTVELRLFNEDRSGGKIKERRLVVVGP
jgi:hypothetical protein